MAPYTPPRSSNASTAPARYSEPQISMRFSPGSTAVIWRIAFTNDEDGALGDETWSLGPSIVPAHPLVLPLPTLSSPAPPLLPTGDEVSRQSALAEQTATQQSPQLQSTAIAQDSAAAPGEPSPIAACSGSGNQNKGKREKREKRTGLEQPPGPVITAATATEAVKLPAKVAVASVVVDDAAATVVSTAKATGAFPYNP